MPEKKDDKKCILFVEDNVFMAEFFADKLKRYNFQMTRAEGGTEAISLMQKDKPCLVVLDFPVGGDMDGFETLKNIREVYDRKSLPVIVMLNLEVPEEVERVIKLGANAHIIKSSISTDDIIKKFKEILAAGDKQLEEKVQHVEELVEGQVRPGSIVRRPTFLASPRGSMGAPTRIKEKIERTLKMSDNEISIIKLVDNLMEFAFLSRASDIHFEPKEHEFLARMRIDGILHDSFKLPSSIQSGIITRIKVLGGMRTDEHKAAQDGRFRMTMHEPEREFDVRISIVPTYYGENAVIRLLAEQSKIKRLEDLAFTTIDLKKIRAAVKRPHGMILATGPTGSGKTTTLYTILKELNTREVSVITIEDPVEYAIDGIDQIQVNARTELTFATGLRSILRQDPNIIMVGEIRDEETAAIAVNAALTGHKLLSTLHTNDAATTLPRLLEMGVEPFLIASTVNIAIAQRLVRMICEKCKTKKSITDAEFQNLSEHLSAEVLDNHRDFFYGKGCDECDGTGYFDRLGIYEILEVNDVVREAIMRRADSSEMQKIAVKSGMTTLLEDGFRKALEGLTTIEEIMRVVSE